jgi:oligopeptide/dipeptide ABC transporter ATP-binding protein
VTTELPTVDPDAPLSVDGPAPLLDVRDLTVEFKTDDGIVHAVDKATFTIGHHETVGIVGESGSGKSVTSLAILGLLPHSANITGDILFKGRSLRANSEKEMQKVRGEEIAMIFQDPLTSLNPVYSIGKQIAEAVLVHHDVSKRAAWERAVDLLKVVGIPFPEQRVNNYPHEMSGGMRQRVVIAIAMANNPEVMIADEPTTALDVTVQAQVLEALEAARTEIGAALVLITHDLGVIAGHADRVCVMYAGKLVESGTVDDIFYRPRMPYALGLLGSLPRVDEGRDARLTPIVGTPPSLLNLPPGCPFRPRCPLAQDVCDEVEPDLIAVDADGQHTAACHFSNQLVDTQATDVFAVTSIDVDTEEVAVADTELAADTPEDAS